MATLVELMKRVSGLEGVEGYIILKRDGSVVLKDIKVQDIENFIAFIFFSCKTCEELGMDLGYNHQDSFIFIDTDENRFYIKSTGKLFVGIKLSKATSMDGFLADLNGIIKRPQADKKPMRTGKDD